MPDTNEQRDPVKEARELLEQITPGKWGYDLNGHVAVVEDDREWGNTLFLIPGKTTPELTREDHANAELVAHAPELIKTLCDEVDRLRKQVADLSHDFDALVKECDESEETMMRKMYGR